MLSSTRKVPLRSSPTRTRPRIEGARFTYPVNNWYPVLYGYLGFPGSAGGGRGGPSAAVARARPSGLGGACELASSGVPAFGFESSWVV